MFHKWVNEWKPAYILLQLISKWTLEIAMQHVTLWTFVEIMFNTTTQIIFQNKKMWSTSVSYLAVMWLHFKIKCSDHHSQFLGGRYIPPFLGTKIRLLLLLNPGWSPVVASPLFSYIPGHQKASPFLPIPRWHFLQAEGPLSAWNNVSRDHFTLSLNYWSSTTNGSPT